MTWQVLEADCVEAMKGMPENSVDAVVTDPPAGISFMGRSWDSDRSGGFVEWLAGVMREAMRVTKPGGHALVWALPRTSHWTGSACEAAGWEIRDRISHHFGSGFPKSLNLGNGQGTALKPATEDWWLCRKPLSGRVAANVERFGTGALNIDGCRIGAEGGTRKGTFPNEPSVSTYGDGLNGACEIEQTGSGRWPANVALSHIPPDENGEGGCQRVGERRVKGAGWSDEDAAANRGKRAIGDFKDEYTGKHYADPDGLETVEAWECAPGCAVAELDRQSGSVRSSGHVNRSESRADNSQVKSFVEGTMGFAEPGVNTYSDSGTASRFFYVAKASRAERNAGLGVTGNGKICLCPGDQFQADTEPPRGTDEAGEGAATDSSTTGSGSKPTARSPKASRSTTSTVTARTTESKTSRSSRRPSTSESTPATFDGLVTDGSANAPSAASGSPLTPSTSTSATEAGFSTDAADPATSQRSSRTSSADVCPDCGGVRQGALRNAHPT